MNFKNQEFDHSNNFGKIHAHYRESTEGLALAHTHNHRVQEVKGHSANPRLVMPARDITDKLNKKHYFHGFQTGILTNKKPNKLTTNYSSNPVKNKYGGHSNYRGHHATDVEAKQKSLKAKAKDKRDIGHSQTDTGTTN